MNNTITVELSQRELAYICDAIEYANEQVQDSNGDISAYWVVGGENDPDKQLEIATAMEAVRGTLKELLQRYTSNTDGNMPCDDNGMLACSTNCPKFFNCDHK